MCKSKPVSVRSNSLFVVELYTVDLKSLYSDNNGIRKTSSPRRSFKVLIDYGSKVSSVAACSRQDGTHILKTIWSTQSKANSSNFQRIISTVNSKSGFESRYAVVQYILKNCTTDRCKIRRNNPYIIKTQCIAVLHIG